MAAGLLLVAGGVTVLALLVLVRPAEPDSMLMLLATGALALAGDARDAVAPVPALTGASLPVPVALPDPLLMLPLALALSASPAPAAPPAAGLELLLLMGQELPVAVAPPAAGDGARGVAGVAAVGDDTDSSASGPKASNNRSLARILFGGRPSIFV